MISFDHAGLIKDIATAMDPSPGPAAGPALMYAAEALAAWAAMAPAAPA